MRTYLLFFALLIAGCATTHKAAPKTTEDKSLLKTIKALDKDPGNAQLRSSLDGLYKDAAQSHLDKIAVLDSLGGIDKWDKIIKEYQTLRELSETVNKSPAAQSELHVPLYITELETAKQNGASAYYDQASYLMNNNDRTSYRQAWYSYKATDRFVANYKDARQQMASAFQKGTINVVINPVHDNSYYYSHSIMHNRYGNSLNNDNFQRDLVRDLGGTSNNIPALFFTDWQAVTNRVRPDWLVDIAWENLSVPPANITRYERSVSKSIETSRDTTGKVNYQTVYATVYITKRYFRATGDLSLLITDAATNQPVTSNRYTDYYDWQVEIGTYSGDSRALSTSDWDVINNRNTTLPPNESVFAELYRKLYPNVKDRLYSLARW